MTIVDLFGFLAAVTSTLSLFPQIYKTSITKKADDISLGMLVLFIITAICWVVYGMMTHTWAVWLTNIIGLVFSTYLFILKCRYDKLATKEISV